MNNGKDQEINTKKPILITGAAGFIGFHLSKRLLDSGYIVVGIDVVNDFYDVKLKYDRLAVLQKYGNFTFHRIDIADRHATELFFGVGEENEASSFDYVVHLAAQVGVRYSVINPHAYINSNVVGFLNILEGCRYSPIKHLVFASSSSVYGANKTMPFSVRDNVDHPVSLYAATKKSDELMAHAYASLFNIPCTGLRFFTAYGPWGRPDMAYSLFARAIIEGKPIDVFNDGQMKRDFTYIDDIIEGLVRIIPRIPSRNSSCKEETLGPSASHAPYQIYNIGNNEPVELLKFIEIIERNLGRKAVKNMLPIQAGDMLVTYADIDDLTRDIGFRPETSIEVGIQRFIEWYRRYYGV